MGRMCVCVRSMPGICTTIPTDRFMPPSSNPGSWKASAVDLDRAGDRRSVTSNFEYNSNGF